MAKMRTRYDHERPCLACGAPWAVTEKGTSTQAFGPLTWQAVGGECSRGHRAHPLADYDEGLAERRRRGWSD